MDYRNVENTERFKYRKIEISNMKGVETVGIGSVVLGENRTVKIVLEMNKKIELKNEEIYISVSSGIKAVETDNNTKVTTLLHYDEKVMKLDLDNMTDFNALEILNDANNKFYEFKKEMLKKAEEIFRFVKYAVEHNWSISL